MSSKTVVFQALPVCALVVSGMVGGQTARAALLGTYAFDGADTDVTLGAAASGVSFGAFQANGVTPTSAAGVFQTVGWTNAGSMNAGQYVGFTAQAEAGYRLDLDSILFDHSRHPAHGPAAGQVQYFNDGVQGGETSNFTPTASGSGSSDTHPWDFTDFSAPSGAEFRIHAWDAGNSAQNRHMTIDNVALHGEVVALAQMSASITPPTVTQVMQNSAFSLEVAVANTATGGTQQEALQYNLGGGPLNLAGGANTTHHVNVDTSTAGQQQPGVNIASNAYATNGVAGQDSFADSVDIDVLARGNAVFQNASGATTTLDNDDRDLTLDFGQVTVGANGNQLSALFELLNEVAGAGAAFTAGVELVSVDDPAVPSAISLTHDFNDVLAAGDTESFSVFLDTSTEGVFSATWVLNFADDSSVLGYDEHDESLTLTVLATVVPEPGSLILLGFGSMLALLRQRRPASV